MDTHKKQTAFTKGHLLRRHTELAPVVLVSRLLYLPL